MSERVYFDPGVTMGPEFMLQYLIPPHIPTAAPIETLLSDDDVLDDLEG